MIGIKNLKNFRSLKENIKIKCKNTKTYLTYIN